MIDYQSYFLPEVPQSLANWGWKKSNGNFFSLFPSYESSPTAWLTKTESSFKGEDITAPILMRKVSPFVGYQAAELWDSQDNNFSDRLHEFTSSCKNISYCIFLKKFQHDEINIPSRKVCGPSIYWEKAMETKNFSEIQSTHRSTQLTPAPHLKNDTWINPWSIHDSFDAISSLFQRASEVNKTWYLLATIISFSDRVLVCFNGRHLVRCLPETMGRT